MSDEDKSNPVLLSKLQRPAYQDKGLEPKPAGKSLLHDDFGILKVSPTPKARVPKIKTISNEPVAIKASKPQRKVEDEDDKFIPPRQNFVSVGNVEHAWYSNKVTGAVDDEDEVDTESLQGQNPLADATDPQTAEAVRYFTKRLNHVKGLVVSELSEITDLEELKNLRANTFGKKGIFTDVIRQLDTLKVNKAVIGELLSQMYSDLELEINSKQNELDEENAAASEVTEWPEDMAVVTSKKESDDEEEQRVDDEDSEGAFEATEGFTAIPEGHFAIIIDGDVIDTTPSMKLAREAMSKLVIANNIEFSRVQFVKRYKLDFGVVIEE